MSQLPTTENIAGKIPYTLKNDYLFRVIMQECEDIRKQFLSTFLNIPLDEIKSANVTNPIELGTSINSKTFILDVNITLNNNTNIITELQIINSHNWPERSVSYLCRKFDALNKGDDYTNVIPAILISILDFTLFEGNPKFYTKYNISDAENHFVYTDKFSIYVLDLTKTEDAKPSQESLVFWAKMFNAITWEEFDMLATENAIASDMERAIKRFVEEDNIRAQCEAREEYYRDKRTTEKLLEQKDKLLTQAQDQITTLTNEVEELRAKLAELEAKQ